MRLFRDLLFLHGHVADPRLARALDASPPHAAPERPVPTAHAAPAVAIPDPTARRPAAGPGRR